MHTILNLYSTQGCHLCDDAEDILKRLQLSYQLIEISDNDMLLESYGLFIPVLECVIENRTRRLNWPFNTDNVLELLKT